MEEDWLASNYLSNKHYDFVPLRVQDPTWCDVNYKVQIFPRNFLIDREGRKVFVWYISDDEDARIMEAQIEALLNRQRPAGS
jgi:hypothetical protein